MRLALLIFLSSFSFVFAQECMTKSDFTKLEQLTSLKAKEWLNRKFSTTQFPIFSRVPSSCAEEQMQEILGISQIGNFGTCFYDDSYENVLTMYQVKNYAPLYLYSCDFSCFDELLTSCRRTLKKKKEGSTSTYTYTTYILGTKNIEFRAYGEDYERNVILLYNKSSLDKILQEGEKLKIQLAKNAIEIAKLQAQLTAKCDSLARQGNAYLLQAKYDEAQALFRQAYLLLPSEELSDLVRKCDVLRCSGIVEEGDSLLIQKKYREAIRSYQKAIDCGADSYEVSERITKAEKQELTDSIIRLEDQANSLFLAREYHKARLIYNQILAMDSWRYETKKRISEIDAMLQFLVERRVKVYDYATLNPLNYHAALGLLEKNLTTHIGATSNGDMLFNLDFSFDTLGRNTSTYGVEGSRLGDYTEQFSELTNAFQLSPSIKNGYFINAETQKEFHVAWQTDKAKYRYTSNGIYHRRGFKSDYNAITAFLKKNYTYGTYTIESKSIAINQEDLRSLKVSSYKANAGPINVLYSMVLPGLGTKRVTYGAQGTGRMLTFLVSGGLAYGAYYLSGVLTEKYQNSAPGTGQKYQQQAEISRYASYGFAGISASIYVYDFFYVLSRGFRNTAKNKRMNQQIMDYSPIKPVTLKLK